MFLDHCVRPKSLLSRRGCLATLFLVCTGLLTLSQPASAQTPLAPVWMSSTISGNGTNKDTGDGGPALSAEQGLIESAVMDQAGNLYISDNGNYVIRKISPNGIITTIAGTAGTACTSASLSCGDGGPATQALIHPMSVALDRDGNLMIIEETNYDIRKVNLATGIITTFAGTPLHTGNSGNGGPATSALMGTPYGGYGDRFGNFYIADFHNHLIRKVDANGIISTFAGTGTAGSAGDGGPAASAELNEPFDIWVDLAGDVYICDYGTNTVRMVDTNGIIHTVAGNGTLGYNSDGIPATTAELNGPHRAIGDGLGNLYIADDHNYLVRKVDPSANITSIAGMDSKTTYVDTDIPATTTGMNPYGIASDSSNNLYITDPTQYRIHRLSLNTGFPATSVGSSSAMQNIAVESTAAITPGTATLSPSTPAQFALGSLSGCALGTSLAANTPCTIPVTFSPQAAGLQTAQLAITDATGKVSVLGLSGVGMAPVPALSAAAISTIIGDGTAGDDSSHVSAPRGGVVDSAGNIYFADSANNAIRRIDHVSGVIATVAGVGSAGYSGDTMAAVSAQLSAPAKVVVDAAGDLYIADTGNSVIRYVDASTGIISTIAGTGTAGYIGDAGLATAAELNHPQGICVDLGGHVYVADTGNNVIRYFGKGGMIVTLVGTGTAGYTGDGSYPVSAELNAPQSVLVDQGGNIYIADTGNNVVRLIAASHPVITTFAGIQGTSVNAGDGGNSVSATLDQPSDIAVDAAGDLYIAAGGQVRTVNVAGTITTLAGTGASGSYGGEGASAMTAVLPSPISNLMLDSAANLVLVDTAANRLLKVTVAMSAVVNLGNVTPGTTGFNQIVSVLNVGNTALNLSGIALSNDFIQQMNGSSDCTSATSLAPGQNCTIGIGFSPAAADTGTITGTLTITDNALNGTASQTVPLSGTAKSVLATATAISFSPASPFYGAPATVTATISNGNALTGTVSFSVNGASIGSAPINGNQAMLQLPILPVATTSITASYSGDSANAESSSTSNLTIQPVALTVTAADATIPFGGAFPAFTYTITGFVNRETVSVVSGTASETTSATSSSSAGNYSINIAQGTLSAANYIFHFMPGTLTIQPPPPPDYTFAVTPATMSVPAGRVAYVTLTLVPLHGYAGTVNLSCSGLPAGTSCAFTGPLTADGLGDTTWTQVMISTAGSQAANIKDRSGNISGIWFAVGVPLCFTGIVLRRRRWISKLLVLVIAAIVTTGMTSCSQGTPNSVAVGGSYQITVTATDASANISHAATFALTIQ
jgi:sugar lactone lactonase YvrE